MKRIIVYDFELVEVLEDNFECLNFIVEEDGRIYYTELTDKKYNDIIEQVCKLIHNTGYTLCDWDMTEF